MGEKPQLTHEEALMLVTTDLIDKKVVWFGTGMLGIGLGSTKDKILMQFHPLKSQNPVGGVPMLDDAYPDFLTFIFSKRDAIRSLLAKTKEALKKWDEEIGGGKDGDLPNLEGKRIHKIFLPSKQFDPIWDEKQFHLIRGGGPIRTFYLEGEILHLIETDSNYVPLEREVIASITHISDSDESELLPFGVKVLSFWMIVRRTFVLEKDQNNEDNECGNQSDD